MECFDVPALAGSVRALVNTIMARPLKVLHILHSFSHGGLENGIVNIINGSPPDIAHELCILTTAGEFLPRIRKPVRCYELHKQSGNSIGIILRVSRIIGRSGADIVHTRNWGAFDGVLAACFHPRIIVFHGEHGRDICDPHGLSYRRNLLRRLLAFRISKFTTVSSDLAGWLTNSVRIPSRKVILLPNGVDAERFRPHRDQALRSELGIGAQDFVIGTIGRLDPIKNHTGLIRAFAMASSRMPDARLVIVGEGPERSRLQSLIEELNCFPSPILAGYRPDVERFYGIFNLFVLNSIAEGMSNTLLEAMASGLPIVCTSVGGATDLIVDGKQGILIPTAAHEDLGRAMCAYHSDPQLCFSHGEENRRVIEKQYSLISMIDRYCQIYADAF